jgi:pimeloyl-ACP methyl ester carboxylesterase
VIPYRIDIPERELVELHRRLDSTRWSAAFTDAGWSLGTDVQFLRALISYWRSEFDWRAAERRLNAVPNFVAELQGGRVHFVHLRSAHRDAVPIILTHGWPSTYAELLRLGDLLSNPTLPEENSGPAFHVVIPALPGYPWSPAPGRSGVGVLEIADLWAQLMDMLGYRRFFAHGGDLGAGVSTGLGLRHSAALHGVHLNYIPGSYRPYVEDPPPWTDEEKSYFERRASWVDEEGAYAHIQGTKPSSLAPSLNDSPAGLAAWIVEKYRSWSDCDGDVERRFSKDELLTIVSQYWFSQAMPSAIRLYAQVRQRPLVFTAGQRVAVPVGIIRFPKELPVPPRSYIERGYNVEHWTIAPTGGHFAAHEEPELLAADIRAFARRVL